MKIVLKLPFEDLKNFCLISEDSSKVCKKIYENDIFWMLKTEIDYPMYQMDKGSWSWSQWYKLHYMTDKLLTMSREKLSYICEKMLSNFVNGDMDDTTQLLHHLLQNTYKYVDKSEVVKINNELNPQQKLTKNELKPFTEPFYMHHILSYHYRIMNIADKNWITLNDKQIILLYKVLDINKIQIHEEYHGMETSIEFFISLKNKNIVTSCLSQTHKQLDVILNDLNIITDFSNTKKINKCYLIKHMIFILGKLLFA